MQSLIGCRSSIFPPKPNLKMYSNYLHATKNNLSNCTSILPIVRKNGSHKIDEKYLEATLEKELIPKHVAIILDGTRRWLKAQGKPLNYDAFFQSNTLFADLCLKWGVSTATTFMYSFKNLQRGQEASDLLFGQLERYLENNLENFISLVNVAHAVINVMKLQERNKSVDDRRKMATSQVFARRYKTSGKCNKYQAHKKVGVDVAICYSGTGDILQATRNICEKVKAGLVEPKAIDEAMLDQELWTRGAPHPDLLIRTGGCLRVSDYLMWQLAQTELYFSQVSAPEFGEIEFLQALRSFQQRERTFGK